MSDTNQVTATTYLILEAQRRPDWTARGGELPDVRGMKAVAIRQGRPTKLARDQIAVRVTVGTDPAVFSPITADLAVDIDPANLIRPVVTDVAPEPAPEDDDA